MTCAPHSARTPPLDGTKMCDAISRTRTPASGATASSPSAVGIFGSQRLAKLPGGSQVNLEILGTLLRIAGDDDAVVPGSRLDRDVLVPDVALDPLGIALERIAPAATALRQLAHDRAGPRAPTDDGVDVLALAVDLIGNGIEHA